MDAELKELRRPDVVLIMGPTASGKTDVALEIARRFPVRLISVDSALVYRGMDIGTGKPDAETLAQFPHALVDICDPAHPYSAGRFRTDAIAEIQIAFQARQVPVLVGGTMLYFKALVVGLADLPKADPAVRAELEAEAARVGWPALHQQLAVVDPVAAARIQPNDAQRIQRALEVYRISGRPLTELHAAAATQAPPFNFHALCWSPSDRERLYERIEKRFVDMMGRGFLDEVRRLHERRDLSAELPSIRSVGYRQLWEHLGGAYPLDEGVRRAILATRHLARRQLIWLRAWPQLTWLDSLDPKGTTEIHKRIEAAAAAVAPY